MIIIRSYIVRSSINFVLETGPTIDVLYMAVKITLNDIVMFIIINELVELRLLLFVI